ncbi:hypothetical protein B4U79_00901 [Dinothrombium tinctorium]|uniref:Uncharacterized protein n=1 Tax=Dinothrombium tinctorium TaxID=1965070 RepID=A0A3S3Q555_9ACAR|nr:hypothetical protein B4U79_00901 [Dinothrombium tinctorium]
MSGEKKLHIYISRCFKTTIRLQEEGEKYCVSKNEIIYNQTFEDVAFEYYSTQIFDSEELHINYGKTPVQRSDSEEDENSYLHLGSTHYSNIEEPYYFSETMKTTTKINKELRKIYKLPPITVDEETSKGHMCFSLRAKLWGVNLASLEIAFRRINQQNWYRVFYIDNFKSVAFVDEKWRDINIRFPLNESTTKTIALGGKVKTGGNIAIDDIVFYKCHPLRIIFFSNEYSRIDLAELVTDKTKASNEVFEMIEKMYQMTKKEKFDECLNLYFDGFFYHEDMNWRLSRICYKAMNIDIDDRFPMKKAANIFTHEMIERYERAFNVSMDAVKVYICNFYKENNIIVEDEDTKLFEVCNKLDKELQLHYDFRIGTKSYEKNPKEGFNFRVKELCKYALPDDFDESDVYCSK